MVTVYENAEQPIMPTRKVNISLFHSDGTSGAVECQHRCAPPNYMMWLPYNLNQSIPLGVLVELGLQNIFA